MSCIDSRVARKFSIQSFAPAPSAVTMGLRLAAFQLANIGVPPRAQRVHQPRRRLLVQGFPEAPQTVKIRHARQNLGTVVSETQPLQTRPA